MKIPNGYTENYQLVKEIIALDLPDRLDEYGQPVNGQHGGTFGTEQGYYDVLDGSRVLRISPRVGWSGQKPSVEVIEYP